MSELRCVCLNLSLSGLKSYARRHHIDTVEALSAATGCGTGCGSCKPYIAEMLRTGRVPPCADVQQYTDLSAMFPDDDDPKPD